MAKRSPKAIPTTDPGYPTKAEHACPEPGRRRFLRQVLVGSTALTVSAASVANAQDGRQIDFSILDEHDPLTPDERSQAPAARARRAAPATEERAEAASTAEEPEVTITEQRALWVEPGYLVLIQWRRPESNADVISAFEGASETVSSHLSTEIADPFATLHDPAQLQDAERALLAVLVPIVAPAEIDVIHLDHDCTSVCSVPTMLPDIQVRGRLRSTTH